MTRTISLDYETFYSADFSVVDLGYYKYARDPRCNPYLISVCDGEETWAGEPKDFNFESLRGHRLVSANSAFDEEISLGSAELGLFTVPGLKPWGMDHWFCALNMASYLWNVRSLADACEAGLGISVSKGVRDRAKGKTADDMKREGWWDEMLKYGQEDAAHCWHLWNKHSAKWPEKERRLSRLTIDQGRHGVRIDIPALEQGIEMLHRVIHTAHQNLPWVARGKKPGSPIGVAEECRAVGIPPPPVKSHDEEAHDAWVERYSRLYPFVMALKNLKRAEKMLATLQTIQSRLRPDETATFSLKYCGAHTRRWAGDGGWNLQNPNKEPLFITPDWGFVHDKKEVERLAEEFAKQDKATGALPSGIQFLDLRGLIIARPGKILCPVDLSQIEPRVLNTFTKNVALLNMIREGMAIYEAFARQSLGWTGGDLKRENKKLYALAKADVLGLGYQAAWEKFITVAWTMARVDITEGDADFALQFSADQKIHRRVRIGDKWVYDSVPEGFAGEVSPTPLPENAEECCFIWKKRKKGPVLAAVTVYGMRSRVTVEQFRESNGLTVELWNRLDEGFKESVGENFILELPNGDALVYRDVRRSTRKKTDPDTGEKYDGSEYTAAVGTKRKHFYGGKLTENLVQATARHVFAENMLRLIDAGHAVLFSVHDEAVVEVDDPGDDEGERRKLVRQIEQLMSSPVDWLPECPLGAEGKLTPRYLK